MRQLPTAAALAILLLTAGVAGVVSAEPNSTDVQTTQTDANVTDVSVATDRVHDVVVVDRVTDRRQDVATADAPTFEGQLTRRLAQYDLTAAQVRDIVSEASRLRDDGASRLVIRSSIVTNLYEFGVDAPFLYADDANDDRPAYAHRKLHRFLRSLDVTPPQARELHATAHRMFEAGATREEVAHAIRRQVAAWDDAPDDYAGDGDRIDRLVHALSDRYDLDRSQTAELERLIRGMAGDGADRTESHGAVSRRREPPAYRPDPGGDADEHEPARKRARPGLQDHPAPPRTAHRQRRARDDG